MRLYLIRHADPDYPNNTITDAGHLEAQALVARLEKEGLDRIYVSPLGRAVDTMRYTADRVGLEPAVEDWIQEIGGPSVDDAEFGRLAAWNVPGHVIRRRPLPDENTWSDRQPFDNPEFRRIYAELQQASDEFLARHGYQREEGAYRITAGNRERIALFCHAGFGMTWLAHLLDLPLTLVWSGLFLAPSSVTTILMDERDGWAVPRCLAIGDTSHLFAAGLPIQPAGIVANYD